MSQEAEKWGLKLTIKAKNRYTFWVRLKAVSIKEWDIFKSMRKGDKSDRVGMSTQGIRNVVKKCAEAIGLKELAPHDLRTLLQNWLTKQELRLIRFK